MLNVRRSYRFLSDFNESMKDIVQIVLDELPSLSYYHWTPIHHDLLTRSSDPIARWSWDALPLYNFALFYLPDRDKGKRMALPGDWMFEINVELDTVFENNNKNASPDSSRFAPAEEAESLISLVAWRCDATAGDGVNWYHAWRTQLEHGEPECLAKMEFGTGNHFSSLYVMEQFENLGNEESVRTLAHRARELFRAELGIDVGA